MGEPLAPRQQNIFGQPVNLAMPKPISVAAAEHLMAVEAERDRYRKAITDAKALLEERHGEGLGSSLGGEVACTSCAVYRILTGRKP